MLDIRNATKRRRWNWLFLQLLINPVTPTQCSSSLPTPQDSPPKIQMRPQHFPATVSCVCFTWKESIHAFALPDPAWTVGTSIILRWTHPSLLQWFQVGQMNYFVNCGLRCLSKSNRNLCWGDAIDISSCCQQLKLENLIVFFPTVGHGMIGFKRILLVKTTSVDATAAGTLPTTAGAAPKSLFPTKGYLNHRETLISSHSLDCFVEEVLLWWMKSFFVHPVCYECSEPAATFSTTTTTPCKVGYDNITNVGYIDMCTTNGCIHYQDDIKHKSSSVRIFLDMHVQMGPLHDQ